MSYSNQLTEYVKAGHSAEYIESRLWASFSLTHSLQSISSDVSNEISKQLKANTAKKFNHAFDFAFEVISNRVDGNDTTPDMIREALLKRAKSISDSEILEACGIFDTYEIE